MATSDYDRLWDMLTKTTDLANRTATNVAALTEAVKNQHEQTSERITKVEQRPASMREWVLAAIALASALITLGGHLSLH